MPIRVQKDLPAKAVLEKENIFTMEEERALAQDIRPLKILILNLMPVKQESETQLLRALSNTPLQVDCGFLMLESHTSKNTLASHLNKFYLFFQEVKHKKFDGLIITGAPIEQMEYPEVDYWQELTEVMEWSKSHVTSTFHICWGAQAGLNYHYGIPKYKRESKLSGIYRHQVVDRRVPLVRSLDDFVMAPHSRYTEVRKEDIEKNHDLIILSESEEAGIFIVMSRDGKQIFVQGHPEYDRLTLHQEYVRDRERGLDPELPCNYYENNDSSNRPVLTWRNAANTLYANWLNYYVYQATPYHLDSTDNQE